MPHTDAATTGLDDQFRLLVGAITDYAIYSMDPDGIVTSWNTGAQRAKGYSASEVIGQNFSLFFTPEDKAAGKPAQALATARADKRFEDEGWRVRKDGTRFWASVVINAILDPSGDLVGFAKITRDMTGRASQQDALRQSERRFRLLMDNVVHYAIFTLDTEGYVTSWNPGAERAKGYARDEILGQSFSLFYTPADRSAGKPAQDLAAALADRRFESESWRVRKDGTRFWASVVIEPMWDDDHQFVGFANITRDITDRLSLDEAREQLHQSQKMEAVGQLTGGVAHDFNNLITVVAGSLDLILKINDDDRIERLIHIAQRASERGAKLTNQLLAFSRRQVLRPQISDVNALILVFEDLLRNAGGESTRFRLNLGSELWLGDIDQAQFQSALLNLVVNARDAMPKGGTLTITTRNVHIDHLAAGKLTDITPGPYIAITVEDTGEGMTPEVRARAIEPFYSTKDVERGTGLGLSQVYGFVRQSNGQLTIRSEPGRGTSVIIYLPRSIRAEAEDLMVAPSAIASGRGTVLVVEDDPDVLEIALEAVQSFGFEVLAAENAAAALAILRREQTVDVLFTDIVMPPGMNGVELAYDACRLRPALRVLLASGYPREAFRDNRQDGMAFIAKPYTLSTLSERLAALGSGAPDPVAPTPH
jgi:PAS domain S-box-containing protein